MSTRSILLLVFAIVMSLAFLATAGVLAFVLLRPASHEVPASAPRVSAALRSPEKGGSGVDGEIIVDLNRRVERLAGYPIFLHNAAVAKEFHARLAQSRNAAVERNRLIEKAEELREKIDHCNKTRDTIGEKRDEAVVWQQHAEGVAKSAVDFARLSPVGFSYYDPISKRSVVLGYDKRRHGADYSAWREQSRLGIVHVQRQCIGKAADLTREVDELEAGIKGIDSSRLMLDLRRKEAAVRDAEKLIRTPVQIANDLSKGPSLILEMITTGDGEFSADLPPGDYAMLAWWSDEIFRGDEFVWVQTFKVGEDRRKLVMSQDTAMKKANRQ